MSVIYTKPEFQPFYTDAHQIQELMLELLGSVDGLTVLEPCAGQGALLKGLREKPARVDAIDIDKRNIALLRQLPSFVRPIHADFIDSFVSEGLLANSPIAASYDAVISNPPYGLRFTVEYRKRIKKMMPQAYVRESYALFMYFAIEALRKGGRYVFIVPDTFLTSRNHRPLRKFILEQGSPSHIIRFPSRLFGSVNFGYGQLCIIAGNRGMLPRDASVVWSEAEEAEVPTFDALKQATVISQSFLVEHYEHGWVHPNHLDAVKFDRPTLSLGDLAECRTGIYTGNNVRFCGFDNKRPPPRCANGHSIDWEKSVRVSSLGVQERIQGIADSERAYVPFIRGGHRAPLEATRWAIDWSISALQIYRTEKKARLQNHAFYFRDGLAVPMVTSGRLSASYISGAVFDQGVVGVFPNDSALLPYLLIYLNSERISERAKAAIGSGANNSANYVKRIPVIVPTAEEVRRSREIFMRALSNGWSETAEEREKFISSLIN